MSGARRRELNLEDYRAGVLAGDRAILGRALTLVESARPDHRALAGALLEALLPHTGAAHRVGITGVPGVGKSTFIEALGGRLTGAGRRVAVLAVDPSSSLSGGSILGDKTRMTALARDPRAFIRPSPSGLSLGGVARATREALLLCEAAGHDVVLVETVGVGQSETVVAEMVDTFLALMLPGAGDELQGIKRGLLELADVIALNKADGERRAAASAAAAEYEAALRYLRPASACWRPRVVTLSALEGAGIAELWAVLEEHRAALVAADELEARRRRQRVRWMWHIVDDRLREALHEHPGVRGQLHELEAAVEAGRVSAGAAADRILGSFEGTERAGRGEVRS